VHHVRVANVFRLVDLLGFFFFVFPVGGRVAATAFPIHNELCSFAMSFAEIIPTAANSSGVRKEQS
jgi:hypothetical protein